MRYVRSAVYYMNYETTPDMDAYQYFTQRSNTNELTEDEIVSLQDAASRLMRNMRNQYTMVQSMNDYYSYGVSVDREYGTDGNLSDVIYDEGEFVKQYYEAGLVISYDSRGVPSVRDSWNLEMDEAELLYYLQEGTMADLMEDNGLYDGDYYTEDEYTETVYTEEYTEETVATSSEEATVAVDVDPYQGDELLMQIPRPQIQNATFAFGVHTISNYGTGYNDYWIEHQAYEHSGYIVGVLVLTVVMIAAALVLQNIPVLGLRRNRLFCLPTEVVACIGVSGFAVSMSVMLTEFGYYTLSSSLTDNLLSAGIGESAVANTATGLIWLSWFCYAFCWYWLAASLLPYLTHPIRTLKERMLCVALWRWIVIILFNESGIELELGVLGLGHSGGDGAFHLRLGHFLPDGAQGGFYFHAQNFIQIGIGVGIHHQDGAVLLFAEVINNHAAGGGLAYPTLAGDCDGMRCCHKCCAP